MSADSGRRAEQASAGFSLVEVVIAMFILALISIAVLPLLVTTTAASVQSRTQVSASSQASAEVALLRQQFRDELENSCAAVASAAAARTGEQDPTTGRFTKVAVSACPSVLPGTITITVEVHPTAALSGALATLTTQLLVATA